MKSTSATLGLSVACLLTLAGNAGAQDRVTVYVGSGEPFESPSKEIRDSTKDVTEKLRDKTDILTLVDSISDADVIVTVVARGMKGTGYVTKGETYSAEIGTHIVYAKLTVGGFSADLYGGSAWSWGGAAGDIADQVGAWIKENYEQLSEMRTLEESRTPIETPPKGRGPEAVGVEKDEELNCALIERMPENEQEFIYLFYARSFVEGYLARGAAGQGATEESPPVPVWVEKTRGIVFQVELDAVCEDSSHLSLGDAMVKAMANLYDLHAND